MRQTCAKWADSTISQRTDIAVEKNIPRAARMVEHQADARAQQLSEILSEFAGQSANAVAKALNDRGLPSARGGKWTARSIINIRARLEDAS
jgi:hypothetical protein